MSKQKKRVSDECMNNIFEYQLQERKTKIKTGICKIITHGFTFSIFYIMFLLYYIILTYFFIMRFDPNIVYKSIKKYFLLINLFLPHIVYHLTIISNDLGDVLLKLLIFNMSIFICISFEIIIDIKNPLHIENTLPIFIQFIYQLLRLMISFKYFADFVSFIFEFEKQSVQDTSNLFLKLVIFFIIEAILKPHLINSMNEILIFFFQSIFLIFKILYMASVIRRTKCILNRTLGVIFYILFNIMFDWNTYQHFFVNKTSFKE
ncbi:hypothetical protein CWI38_0962p0030 [Hamiltosporidium tvaerminnensis]|uniref:Transmembrane protein n=1 Tax=Hamiltosporidium tvaerminnensis TaxID=1176355 RepID=A0A4Q9LTW9_9MICR|nr:hypothetical protein CWI38_0962p0030 [Hamiltosporidium tvaerminnensis]